MSMANSIAKLIEAFQSECEKAFAFLVAEHRFKRECGLSDFESPRPNLKSLDPEKIPNVFWAVQRFERGDIRIEIGFGDRELLVEGCYWKQGQEFALWEILEAAGRDSSAISGNIWVNNPSSMSQTLQGMAGALREQLSLFLERPRSLFGRALALREQRRRAAHESERLHDLDRARNKASEAFRAKNYSRVISLLTPFTDILTEADKKKIALSEKYQKRNI